MTHLSHTLIHEGMELTFTVIYKSSGEWTLESVTGSSPYGVVMPSMEVLEEMALTIDWDQEYLWVMEEYYLAGERATI